MTLAVVVTHRFEGTADQPASQRVVVRAAVTTNDRSFVYEATTNRHADTTELTLDEALDDAVARVILHVVEQVRG